MNGILPYSPSIHKARFESMSGGEGSTLTMVWSVSAGETIYMPNPSGYTYDYYIDWGDNTPIEHITTINVSHTYTNAGTYTSKIDGLMPCINFLNVPASRDNIIAVSGGSGMVFQILNYAFYFCSNLISFNCPNWDITSVTAAFRTFRFCSSLTTLNVKNWKTQNIISMDGLVQYCSSLTSEMPDYVFWNNLGGGSSSVTSHSATFGGATNISNYADIPADWK
jgi:surface protein